MPHGFLAAPQPGQTAPSHHIYSRQFVCRMEENRESRISISRLFCAEDSRSQIQSQTFKYLFTRHLLSDIP